MLQRDELPVVFALKPQTYLACWSLYTVLAVYHGHPREAVGGPLMLHLEDPAPRA